MIGNLGGSFGPTVVGEAAKKGDFAMAFGKVFIFPLLGAAIILLIGFVRRGKAVRQD
jgi:hypothetical protein